MSASLGGTDDRAFRRMLSPLKRFGKIVRDNGQTNAHVWYVVFITIIFGVSFCPLFDKG
jgi:hypothetical protein